MDYLNDSYRSMFRRLLPSAIGAMLSETVASFIDALILSKYLGPDMLSTISVCMPIYMFVNTLSMLIVSGGATLFAQALGRGDKEDAARYYTCSIAMMVFCGILLTVGGLMFTEPIIRALGSGGDALLPTVSYARVLFSFMVPLVLYQQLMVYVRFDGAPMLSLTSTLVCAVVNLVLDVLFVGPLEMKAPGAALATCLAYTVAMLINAAHLFSRKNGLKLKRKSLDLGRIVRILKVGIPISITQLGMAIATSFFNVKLMKVGGVPYQDVYSVITQLSVIAMALYEGIAQACQPIMAACFGGEKFQRLTKTVRYGFRLELAAMLFAMAAYILLADPIANMFSMTEAAIHSVAVYAIRAYSFSLLFTGFNTMIVYYFQTQERSVEATVITLLCSTILPVAALYGLSPLLDGLGVWWCYVPAQVLTLVLSLYLYFRDKRNNFRFQATA